MSEPSEKVTFSKIIKWRLRGHFVDLKKYCY